MLSNIHNGKNNLLKLKRYNISKEELYSKYVIDGRGVTDICNDYGCSFRTIAIKLKKYGIKLRNGKESHNMPKYQAKLKLFRRKSNIIYDKLPENPTVGTLIDGKLIGRNYTYIYCECSACGKKRWLSFNNVKHRVGKDLCMDCCRIDDGYRKSVSKGLRKRYENVEEREKTGMAAQRFWAENPDKKEKQADILREYGKNRDNRNNMVRKIKEYWDDNNRSSDKKQKLAERSREMMNERWSNSEYYQKHCERKKTEWADITYRNMQIKKMMKGNKSRPTRLEKRVLELVDNMYPNQWKYVGDGDVILGGRNPDFINMNGCKAIIEVNGTFWHSYQRTKECPLLHELDRISHYKQYGYHTLVIWGHEFKNKELLVKKIQVFHLEISKSHH